MTSFLRGRTCSFGNAGVGSRNRARRDLLNGQQSLNTRRDVPREKEMHAQSVNGSQHGSDLSVAREIRAIFVVFAAARRKALRGYSCVRPPVTERSSKNRNKGPPIPPRCAALDAVCD